ncbi:MAG: hypothetical protein V1714_04390 [Pseudomonadota bacterium]
MDNGRRQFFARFLSEQAVKTLAGFQEGLREARSKADFDAFFSDYESSYPLTLAYPDDILLETALKEGIPVEGREKIDIVKELFLKKGGYGYR